MKNLFIYLLIVIIAFFALFPRIIEVLNQNYVFGFDQGRDFLAVHNIVVNHKFTLIGPELGSGSAGFSGIFHGPFFYYLLAIPFVIFNGDPYSGIVLMFLFGIFTMVFSYFLGKKLFGCTGGLIIALLIAISPSLISHSRLVWLPHVTSLFILLTFYFIYTMNKSNKNVFFAAFFSGFIYNFEFAITVPLVLALCIYSVYIFRFKQLKQYIFLFLGLIVAFSPMILFELRHGFLGTRGVIDYLTHPKATADNLKFMELITRDHLGTLWYNFFDSFPNQNIIPSIIIPLITLLTVVAFLIKEKNIRLKHFIIFLLTLPFINFMVFSFLRSSIYTYYLTDLNLAYIILFTYAIFNSYVKNNFILKVCLTIFLIISILFAASNSFSVSIYDYSDYGGTAKVKGKIDAIDYIYKDAKGQRFNLLVFTPPVYTYAYDYLLEWYAKRRYNYYPSQEKKEIFYLLIEIDREKPWSYKGWLETVVKEGTILDTKTLPSGFIIQKRLIEDKNEI